jgi:hypothetical protein
MKQEALSDIDNTLHFRIVQKWIVYDFEIEIECGKIQPNPENRLFKLF